MSPPRKESWRRFIVPGLLAANPSRSSLFLPRFSVLRCYSSASAPPKQPSVSPARKMAQPNSLQGQSGRIYTIEKVLQEKEFPPSHVYLATAEDQKFILKNVSKTSFPDYQEIYRSLHDCPNLRVSCDTIPDRSTFVYKYFSDHLLSLAQENPPLPAVKRILKDALRGLAKLHENDIVHTDIKPNNILIQRQNAEGMEIDQVQLADLEDSAHVPPDCDIVGKQAGNWMWRSPEAHASGPVNKPSDMFSFGIVCIYAVHKRVIFAVGEHELGDGEELLAHVLQRQISYCADKEGLAGLLKHLGDSPWVEVFGVLRDGFNADNPRKPISLWQGVDEELKDLVGRLTNFDPAKRLTAREALNHPWFCSGR